MSGQLVGPVRPPLVYGIRGTVEAKGPENARYRVGDEVVRKDLHGLTVCHGLRTVRHSQPGDGR